MGCYCSTINYAQHNEGHKYNRSRKAAHKVRTRYTKYAFAK